MSHMFQNIWSKVSEFTINIASLFSWSVSIMTWFPAKNGQVINSCNDIKMLFCKAIGLASATKKITEKWLKWYGHVKSRDEGHVLKRKETERKTENQVERLV